MPNILSTSQKEEWELANALKEFLPGQLEWRDVGGYPILYQKGFLGSLTGCIAFLTGNRTITIERRGWKDAILEALEKYQAANGTTIQTHFPQAGSKRSER